MGLRRAAGESLGPELGADVNVKVLQHRPVGRGEVEIAERMFEIDRHFTAAPIEVPIDEILILLPRRQPKHRRLRAAETGNDLVEIVPERDIEIERVTDEERELPAAAAVRFNLRRDVDGYHAALWQESGGGSILGASGAGAARPLWT